MGVVDAPGDWHGQIDGGLAPFADRPLVWGEPEHSRGAGHHQSPDTGSGRLRVLDAGLRFGQTQRTTWLQPIFQAHAVRRTAM